MTTPRPYTPAIVRRASLVDVPAVARLATSASLPSEEQDGSDVDPGHMQSAMRLMMAHHALEDGQVWVAEQTDGTLLVASIWLPPEADIEPAPEQFGRLFARELHFPPPAPDLSGALKQACPDRPHWKIILFCESDHIGAWGPELARELLGPGLDVVDEHGGASVAITLSADQLPPLRPLGFTDPIEVPLAPEVGVSMTFRAAESAAVPAADTCQIGFKRHEEERDEDLSGGRGGRGRRGRSPDDPHLRHLLPELSG